MSLYFSAAVWTSLALSGFGLVREALFRYRTNPANPDLPPRRLSARVGASPRPPLLPGFDTVANKAAALEQPQPLFPGLLTAAFVLFRKKSAGRGNCSWRF